MQKSENEKHLYVSRKLKPEDTIVKFDNGGIIGDGNKSFVFGPCSVESQEQVDAVAKDLQARGEKFIRGGAFKPRTSPYDFQGLGIEGLKILKNVKDKFGLNVVSEIVNPADFEVADEYLDVFQIGARNMQNFELLKEAGRTNKPILLKEDCLPLLRNLLLQLNILHHKGIKILSCVKEASVLMKSNT